MISSIISRLVILVFGTLYPAYASYKAVRTKNVKEYVKWMMYWIVFALFTCAETFTDVFCSFWFPFYYEFKVILVLWLLSPATKGSSILYRKFVHPMLTKREQEIDEYIAKAKEQGYHTVLTLGSKGVNYATTVIMQTAIKGGGGLVNQLRRSYSLSDISADMDALAEMNRIKALPEDELDIADTPLPKDARLRRSRGYSPRRSASGSGRVEMYFPEVDVNVRQRGTRPRETGIPLSHIRSNEDVSSGYSSAEMLYSGHPPVTEAQEPLVRTSSVGSSRVTRTKVARGGAIPKRPTAAEDNLSRSESEESDSGTQEHFYDVTSASHSEPVGTPPCATISQAEPSHHTGSDFKSHLPVALEGQPVLPIEENVNYTNAVQNLTNNYAVGLLEDQSTVVNYHPNQEEGRKQDIAETIQGETTNLEERKSSEEECNTHTDPIELISDIVKNCQPCEKEISSVSEAPYLEVLKTNEITETLGIDSLPQTVHCDELEIESSPSATTCVPQEVLKTNEDTNTPDINSLPQTVHYDELGIELSPNATTCVPQEVLKTNEDTKTVDFISLPSLPQTVHCDELGIESSPSATTCVPQEVLKTNEDTKTVDFNSLPQTVHCDELGIESSPSATTCVPQEVLKTNEDTKTVDINSLPQTVHCDELVIESCPSTSTRISQEFDDVEFFDTESDMTQNAVAGHNSNLHGELEIHNSPSVSEVDKNNQPVNSMILSSPDVSKTSEHVDFNKVNFIPTTIHCEEIEIVNENIMHESEGIEFFDTETDISQNSVALADNSKIVPVTSEFSQLSLREVQNEDKIVENNAQKSTDEISKDGRAGRYNKHPAPSPPPKTSTEDLHLITPNDELECESNVKHDLVPDQMSLSSMREKSRSKSPQCSPHVNETNAAHGKSEHNTNVTTEQIAPTEKINNSNPVTASYAPASFTGTQDMRPSEYYYNQYRAQASPKQSKKEIKSKQDTRFFSRILSKPRSQLASFFPFFTSRDVQQPLSDSLTTSLTSLDDMRAQERVRSSSVAGTLPTTSEYMSPPPEVPPRRRTPEQSGECGTRVNIREMSHSPTRH